jgi:hypothetical protein
MDRKLSAHWIDGQFTEGTAKKCWYEFTFASYEERDFAIVYLVLSAVVGCVFNYFLKLLTSFLLILIVIKLYKNQFIECWLFS